MTWRRRANCVIAARAGNRGEAAWQTSAKRHGPDAPRGAHGADHRPDRDRSADRGDACAEPPAAEREPASGLVERPVGAATPEPATGCEPPPNAPLHRRAAAGGGRAIGRLTACRRTPPARRRHCARRSLPGLSAASFRPRCSARSGRRCSAPVEHCRSRRDLYKTSSRSRAAERRSQALQSQPARAAGTGRNLRSRPARRGAIEGHRRTGAARRQAGSGSARASPSKRRAPIRSMLAASRLESALKSGDTALAALNKQHRRQRRASGAQAQQQAEALNTPMSQTRRARATTCAKQAAGCVDADAVEALQQQRRRARTGRATPRSKAIAAEHGDASQPRSPCARGAALRNAVRQRCAVCRPSSRRRRRSAPTRSSSRPCSPSQQRRAERRAACANNCATCCRRCTNRRARAQASGSIPRTPAGQRRQARARHARQCACRRRAADVLARLELEAAHADIAAALDRYSKAAAQRAQRKPATGSRA